MNERTRKIVVYSALGLAIIWGIYNFLPKSSPGSEVQSASVAAAAPSAINTAAVEKTIDVAEMKSKSWGDDPFRSNSKPVVSGGQYQPSWNLNGIIYNPSKPLAIINGKSVSVGDKIDNATVKEIAPKTVILDHGGATVTLRVKKR